MNFQQTALEIAVWESQWQHELTPLDNLIHRYTDQLAHYELIDLTTLPNEQARWFIQEIETLTQAREALSGVRHIIVRLCILYISATADIAQSHNAERQRLLRKFDRFEICVQNQQQELIHQHEQAFLFAKFARKCLRHATVN